MQTKYKKELSRYLLILIGGMILASGVSLLLVPNEITSGGTPGMAILINYFTGFSVGMIMLAINIPLILISMKFIGRGYAFRTVFAVLVIALSTDILLEFFKLPALTHEPLLAAVFGGMFIGLGVGLILHSSASPGGPSIIVGIIARKTHWKEGNMVVLVDALIVFSAGFVFPELDSMLWSLLGVYVSGRGINLILSGRPSKKVVHISSDNAETIKTQLIHKLGHEGGMILEGEMLHTGNERRLLMLIIDNNKVQSVRQIVKEFDPSGVVVVMEASE
ncbi:YitT family protein [Thiomicrorhabdus sp. 6S3-12]|uniref:YitT family protein n=1 Tax=Thiomicrorhabdus sp. 6S3-12 TaxID=2819681 RepID=UPI001AAC7B55|nr:YitT family protein [Thiomicrorhabdus sp. 6S3-12]MBO1924323.1 YitT family protein [Thiomicrorhabdus sp. 6S3-12]